MLSRKAVTLCQLYCGSVKLMIYLDNNATTRPAREVVAAMLGALETG